MSASIDFFALFEGAQKEQLRKRIIHGFPFSSSFSVSFVYRLPTNFTIPRSTHPLPYSNHLTNECAKKNTQIQQLEQELARKKDSIQKIRSHLETLRQESDGMQNQLELARRQAEQWEVQYGHAMTQVADLKPAKEEAARRAKEQRDKLQEGAQAYTHLSDTLISKHRETFDAIAKLRALEQELAQKRETRVRMSFVDSFL